jgi:hypothetical protein
LWKGQKEKREGSGEPNGGSIFFKFPVNLIINELQKDYFLNSTMFPETKISATSEKPPA